MPRVGVREGWFVEFMSGTTVTPRGVNYIRLQGPWHRTFAPEQYDGDRAGRMLEDLQRRGFNVVRVFLDTQPGTGTVQTAGAAELSQPYLEHLLDFLRRAEKARVWVVICAPHLPPAERYTRMAGSARTDVAGVNRWYLDEGVVKAKAAYMADLVTAIKDSAPQLLSTVWAFELENEAWFNDAQPPFNRREGEFRGPGDKLYRLDDGPQAQELMDDAIVAWADTCAAAIRAVDVQAMVTTSVFSPQAVGLRGFGHLRPADAKGDRRVPARLLALTRSQLSYLDLHLYPFDRHTLDKDLSSVEFKKLKQACERRGLPLVMGEFGAFKSAYANPEDAARAIDHHVRQVMKLGFAGYLYWTYDTDEQTDLWNALSGDGAILRGLERWGNEAP